MFVLLTMFVLGVLHGLGPDHLAAIATLVGRERRSRARRRVAWLGLRFGLGHVGALLLLAGFAWAAGRALPEHGQRLLEQWSGAVLVFVGGWTFIEAARGRVTLHSHGHGHAHPGGDHSHLHLHLGDPADHRHPHVEYLAGGLMGFSGAPALLAAMPVVFAGSFLAALGRVGAFGLGIVAAMAAAGWLAHEVAARAARTPAYGRWLAGVAGAACALLGVAWVLRNTM
jgi:ABC-type nickel/cobalt efflux system permease component RcnA